MDILRELFGFGISTSGLSVSMAWMVLWPVMAVEAAIHYRCFKSLGKKTK